MDRRVANSWAFYDWANSVYPLVIMSTLFPIYYAGVTSNNDGIVAILGMEMSNTQLFDYSLSFAYLLIASISPLLSGIADYAGKKMFFMKIFCYLGALACGAMYFFTADNLTFGTDLLFIDEAILSILFSSSFDNKLSCDLIFEI